MQASKTPPRPPPPPPPPPRPAPPPPGTGKTQTILNIIANILVRGKTVQVVSNNNSAIVNVLEKLSKYDMGFIVALLGSTVNNEKFIET